MVARFAFRPWRIILGIGQAAAAAVAVAATTSGTTALPKLVEHSHISYPIGHLSTIYWVGLEPGDVIFSVNNTPVNALVALRTIVGRLPANAPCVLQVQRQGQLMYLSFEIE